MSGKGKGKELKKERKEEIEKVSKQKKKHTTPNISRVSLWA